MKKEILLIIILMQLGAAVAQNWQTDFAKAKQIATEQNKHIVLVFQGSDWCAPCIKLDREIWTSDVFIDYANEHYVMLKADFPRKKQNKLSEEQAEANAKLAETYNKRGFFPLVLVLNSKGSILGETGYKKTTPEAYIQELNSFIK
jgi:thioredoxin-related protein